MWNHCCGWNGQVSPAYDYCDHVSPVMEYDKCDSGYKGSWFVLLVVLFILLIIVGSVYC